MINGPMIKNGRAPKRPASVPTRGDRNVSKRPPGIEASPAAAAV